MKTEKSSNYEIQENEEQQPEDILDLQNTEVTDFNKDGRENNDTEDEMLFIEHEFDLSLFQSVSSTSKSRESSRTGGELSIVRSEKNGKRLELSRKLMKKLGFTNTIQIIKKTDEIAISQKFSNDYKTFTIRTDKSGEKGYIYCAQLIEEFVRDYKMDFSNRTCITYYEESVRHTSYNGLPVLIVKMK